MIVLPRSASYYLNVPVIQFRALRDEFELVQEHLPELIKRRGLPGWDGDPATAGETVKAQLHQSMSDRIMPESFRAAILIALWGHYESTLIIVADSIRRLDRGMPVLPTGSGLLRQMKRYFKKHVGFPLFPTNRPSLEEDLKIFQRVRNVLIHANGMKQATKPEDWEFLERYVADNPASGLDLTRNYLDVTPNFVRSQFTTIGEVIQHVTDKGRDRLDELGVKLAGLPDPPPPPNRSQRFKHRIKMMGRRLGFRSRT